MAGQATRAVGQTHDADAPIEVPAERRGFMTGRNRHSDPEASRISAAFARKLIADIPSGRRRA